MHSALNDAWRVIVPVPGDRHGPLAPLLLTLTIVSGIVDAFSYLVLGHVFVANMTGNVVFIGFALAGAKGFSTGASLTALAAFVVGALASGTLARGTGTSRGTLLAATTGIQVVLVTASIGVAASFEPSTGSARYVLVVLLGLAMGLQGATARRLAVPDLTTTVLTQTITGIAADSRIGTGTGSKIGRRGLAALAMFAGALIGAAFVLQVHRPLALVVALALVTPVAAAAWVLSRSGPDWDSAD